MGCICARDGRREQQDHESQQGRRLSTVLFRLRRARSREIEMNVICFLSPRNLRALLICARAARCSRFTPRTASCVPLQHGELGRNRGHTRAWRGGRHRFSVYVARRYQDAQVQIRPQATRRSVYAVNGSQSQQRERQRKSVNEPAAAVIALRVATIFNAATTCYCSRMHPRENCVAMSGKMRTPFGLGLETSLLIIREPRLLQGIKKSDVIGCSFYNVSPSTPTQRCRDHMYTCSSSSQSHARGPCARSPVHTSTSLHQSRLAGRCGLLVVRRWYY